MRRLIILLFILTNLQLFSQNIGQKLNCDDFSFTTNSNTRMEISFLSAENYSRYEKDSIEKDGKKLKEDIELNKIFQKKYPNKITVHCINSKIYEDNDFRNYSYCNESYKIKLVAQKFNFYIFKVDAFEVNNYLLFNTDNQTIYTLSNYPQILENGKIVVDVGYEYGGSKIINYYSFEKEKLKYFELIIPAHYNLQNIKIIKSFNSTPKVIGNFIQYGYKEVFNNEYPNGYYEYDKENFCQKFIMIN